MSVDASSSTLLVPGIVRSSAALPSIQLPSFLEFVGNTSLLPNSLAVMRHAVRQLMDSVDSRMERLILRSRGTEIESLRSPLGLAAVGALPIAALIKLLSGPYNSIDLFIFGLVLCCILFRHYGFLAVLLALTLDLLVKAIDIYRLGRPELWPKYLLDSAVHAVEWSVVCAFVVITLKKWATLRVVKQRTDDDLALAKSLQSSLARKSCELKKVTIQGSIHQCDSVGGDFYYFRPFGKKMVSFCIGDVMGKGLSASLLMAMVMSFVYEWGKQSCNPAKVAARLSHRLTHLWDGRRGWFITIFYGMLDEETGTLQYCAAGQQGGFLLRDDEVVEIATECDPPLGIVENYEFTHHSINLKPGDHLLLFTDGAYEAHSPTGEQFGTDRLKKLFQRWAPRLNDCELMAKLEQEVLSHTGGRFTDDTTLLSLRYHEARESVPEF